MAENQKTQTSTQIRNLYSDGMSYLNVKFFNTNLSFQMYPYSGQDPNGRSTYDMKHGQTTTVNYEGAYALYSASKDIVSGKVQEMMLQVPCAGGAELTLERKQGNDGKLDTIFTIKKNNVSIPFKFKTMQEQVKENGQIITKTIEVGLGAFAMILEGYLTGINADRHLNKLTDDFAKLQNRNGNNNGNGYQPQNNFKRPANAYKKNYQQSSNSNWNQPAPRETADFSTYHISDN